MASTPQSAEQTLLGKELPMQTFNDLTFLARRLQNRFGDPSSLASVQYSIMVLLCSAAKLRHCRIKSLSR